MEIKMVSGLMKIANYKVVMMQQLIEF